MTSTPQALVVHSASDGYPGQIWDLHDGRYPASITITADGKWNRLHWVGRYSWRLNMKHPHNDRVIPMWARRCCHITFRPFISSGDNHFTFELKRKATSNGSIIIMPSHPISSQHRNKLRSRHNRMKKVRILLRRIRMAWRWLTQTGATNRACKWPADLGKIIVVIMMVALAAVGAKNLRCYVIQRFQPYINGKPSLSFELKEDNTLSWICSGNKRTFECVNKILFKLSVIDDKPALSDATFGKSTNIYR